LDEFQATELLPAATLCSDSGLFPCHMHIQQQFTGFVVEYLKTRSIAIAKKANRARMTYGIAAEQNCRLITVQ